MKHFRKITVDGPVYRWLFRYQDYDYSKMPYLLIIPSLQPDIAMKI